MVLECPLGELFLRYGVSEIQSDVWSHVVPSQWFLFSFKMKTYSHIFILRLENFDVLKIFLEILKIFSCNHSETKENHVLNVKLLKFSAYGELKTTL